MLKEPKRIIAEEPKSPGIINKTTLGSDSMKYPDKGFQWIGKCNIDKRAEAVVCSKKATKKEKASEYLRIMLSVEDVPSAEIIRRMDRIGIKERTIRTVQKEIGIEAYRKQGIWYWHMPEPEEEVDEE